MKISVLRTDLANAVGNISRAVAAKASIPALEGTYHSIIYQNLKNSPSPEVNRYAEEVGLVELPTLADIQGYRFVGWYTASQEGELVDYIPKGSTQEYVLFARWELIEYTITYYDAPSHTNPLKYTVEDELVITDPAWDGLTFSHWTDGTDKTVIVKDSFGNDQLKIEKGTTGGVELRANWRVKENSVKQSTESDIIIVFDENTGNFHFVYKLGVIDQVKVESLQVIEKNLNSQEHTWAISDTVTLSKTNTSTVSETVSQTITKTQQWQNSCAWQQANSKSVNSQVSSNLGVELEGIKASIAASLGTTVMGSESRTDTTVEGGTIADGKQQSDSVTSSVSYVDSSTITVTETSKLMSDAPYGTYEYACVGTVHVFAVVTYDPENGNFYLNTYSVLDGTLKKAILYTPASDVKANIIPNKGLDYYIPEQELLDRVHNAYYVRFNNNVPDKSESLIVAYGAGEDHSLYENKFKRDGFVFAGWSSKSNGGVEFEDKQGIKDLVGIGDIVNLYAVWEPEMYKANWGEGINSTITVTRTSSPYKGASIGKLSNNSDVYFGDVLSITYAANTGYYFASNGKGVDLITVDGNVTSKEIFAKADPIKYIIKYNANGGSGNMANTNCTYDMPSLLARNSFTRHGWAFAGWNTKADGSGTKYTEGLAIKNLSATNGATINLFAQWKLITTYDYSFDTFEVNNGINGSNGMAVTLTDRFDMDELKRQGYTMHVTMNFTLKDKDAGSDKKYIYGFRIYNGTTDVSPKLYDRGTAEIGAGYVVQNYTDIVCIGCNSLANYNVGFLFVEDTYALFGAVTNRYNVEGLVMTVYFTK